MKNFLFAFLVIWVLLMAVVCAHAQTPYLLPAGTITPIQNGIGPCAGCFLYTYVSGTYTPLATDTDYTGAYANTNPIVLNSNGYAQTAVGVQVGIWLQPTATYRLVLQNAAHVQIYQIDGVTGQFPGSISNPLTIADATCNQITVGVSPFTIGLCFPAPASAITWTFQNTGSDTVVGRNTTDALTNKTLTSPTETTPTVNGVSVANSPGTYISVTNASSAGTVLNYLAKFTGSPSTVTVATTSDITGILGIVVSGAGSTGSAVIQETGTASCYFDGSTTAGHYFIESVIVNGECHDSGVGPTGQLNGQALGQVMSTASGGNTVVTLYGPNSASQAIGNIPTIASGAALGAGGTVTLVAGSRDKVGQVQVTTGTSPPSGGGVFVITFSSPFPNFAACAFSPQQNPYISTFVFWGSSSISNFVVNVLGTLAPSTLYGFSYVCNGY